jgi:hypothetical protein
MSGLLHDIGTICCVVGMIALIVGALWVYYGKSPIALLFFALGVAVAIVASGWGKATAGLRRKGG